MSHKQVEEFKEPDFHKQIVVGTERNQAIFEANSSTMTI